MVSCTIPGAQICSNNVIWECQAGEWVGIADANCAGFRAGFQLRSDYFDLIFNDFGARSTLINEINTRTAEAFPTGNISVATFPSTLEFDVTRKKLFINFSTTENLAALNGTASLDIIADILSFLAILAGIIILIGVAFFGLPVTILTVGGAIALIAGGLVFNILSGEQEIVLTEADIKRDVLNNPNISPEDKATILRLLNEGAYEQNFLTDITNLILVGAGAVIGVLVARELISSGVLKFK